MLQLSSKRGKNFLETDIINCFLCFLENIKDEKNDKKGCKVVFPQ